MSGQTVHKCTWMCIQGARDTDWNVAGGDDFGHVMLVQKSIIAQNTSVLTKEVTIFKCLFLL